MIRVALVVHRMEPGGIERSVARIASGLNRNEFEPIVICLDRTGSAAKWLPENVPVVEIHKREGNDLRAVKRLSAQLRELSVDIVQSHNWGTLVETALARKLASVPKHIHAERGTVLGQVKGRGLKHRIRATVMRNVLRTVDSVMSNAHSVAQRVENRCGYPAEAITVIPNGVPSLKIESLEERNRIRSSLGVKPETVLVGTVGRLHPVKGFDVLVEAMVHPKLVSTHLLIVGDGEQAHSLKMLSEKCNVRDRVHFAGHQDHIAPWYSSMDMYVNSSHSEGMSQSIVEAMSVGLPIVATDVGDARFMVNGSDTYCGAVCPANDSNQLGEAIALLANDVELRCLYSSVAINQHAIRYSESGFIESMQRLYRQIDSDAPADLALGSDERDCNASHAGRHADPMHIGDYRSNL